MYAILLISIDAASIITPTFIGVFEIGFAAEITYIFMNQYKIKKLQHVKRSMYIIILGGLFWVLVETQCYILSVYYARILCWTHAIWHISTAYTVNILLNDMFSKTISTSSL